LSCAKILHDSWSISAALARGFSDPLTILKEEKALGTRFDLTGLALQGQKSDQSKVGPGSSWWWGWALG